MYNCRQPIFGRRPFNDRPRHVRRHKSAQIDQSAPRSDQTHEASARSVADRHFSTLTPTLGYLLILCVSEENNLQAATWLDHTSVDFAPSIVAIFRRSLTLYRLGLGAEK